MQERRAWLNQLAAMRAKGKLLKERGHPVEMPTNRKVSSKSLGVQAVKPHNIIIPVSAHCVPPALREALKKNKGKKFYKTGVGVTPDQTLKEKMGNLSKH